MEPLTILAILKFGWEIYQEMTADVIHAEHNSQLDTGDKKHNYVIQNAARSISKNTDLKPSEHVEMVRVLNQHIRSTVNTMNDNGIFAKER
jgi:hypothetical protein